MPHVPAVEEWEPRVATGVSWTVRSNAYLDVFRFRRAQELGVWRRRDISKSSSLASMLSHVFQSPPMIIYNA